MQLKFIFICIFLKKKNEYSVIVTFIICGFKPDMWG